MAAGWCKVTPTWGVSCLHSFHMGRWRWCARCYRNPEEPGDQWRCNRGTGLHCAARPADLGSRQADRRTRGVAGKAAGASRATWLFDNSSSPDSPWGQQALDIKLRWTYILLAALHSCAQLIVAAQVEVGGGDRVLPLASFRGTTRPVLLAGSKAYLQKAQAAAEPYRQARPTTAAASACAQRLPKATCMDLADRRDRYNLAQLQL